MTAQETDTKSTPLNALHRELGGRMVPFAGYDMPVQFPAGIMKEHLHTREAAGLFDVSHMGQVRLRGARAARAAQSHLWRAGALARKRVAVHRRSKPARFIPSCR